MNRTAKLALLIGTVVAGGCLTGTLLAINADQTITGNNHGRFGADVEGRFDFSMKASGKTLKITSGTAISAPEPGSDRVYIFDDADLATGADLDTTDAWVFQGASGGEAGWALAAGNVTKLVGSELLIAAPSERGGKGRVYVLNMLSGKLADRYVVATLTGDSALDYFGWDVTTGNFNGDGYQDVLVGAAGVDGLKGAVYVFYGPISGDLTVADADITIRGITPKGLFGNQVAAARLDGDWTDEVIVGAYQERTSGVGGPGKVHIFWNAKAGVYDWTDIADQTTFHGASTIANLGYSLDAGGDANDDGVDDLLIGAPAWWCHNTSVVDPVTFLNSFCPSTFQPGKAYLVLGSSKKAWPKDRFSSVDVELHADASLSGVTDRTSVGVDVNFVGDLNADGKDDMVVGSLGVDEAYLAYGGSMSHADTSMGSITKLHNNDSAEVMGSTGAYIGDIDKDGIDDVIIMAPGQLWFGASTATKGVGYIWNGKK